ncbi:MAG: type IX secretion system membrane protein PorP/SprF [Vicingaceae bacterium]
MKKHYLIFSILSVFIFMKATAQNELHYGMYMMHQPLFNPAAASSYTSLTAAALYKNQWVGYDGAPTIGAFNILKPLKNSTIGLTVTDDQIGINNNTGISGSYAYKIQLRGYSRLAFGVSATVNLLQSDMTGVSISDINDPTYSGESTGMIAQPNFKFGTYYFNNKFYAGIAIPNILNNKITEEGAGGITEFDANSVHYFLHLGYRFELNPKSDFNVSTFIKQVSGTSLQYDINVQYEYMKKVGIGVSYRSSNEVLGIISYQLIPELKLAYAYEYGLGEIGDYSSGSHEVMLIYQFAPPKKTIISAPRF